MDIKIYPADDGNTMYYIASNGTHQINYSTDGDLKPHMLISEFEEFATIEFNKVKTS